MKMKTIAFAVVAFFTVFSTAFAAVQDFGDLTLDVPAGWTANKTENTIAVTADDNSAALSVTLAENDGTDVAVIADAFLQQLNGVDPEFDGDTYSFSFENTNGVESFASLTGDETFYFLLVATGFHDDFDAIIDSIELK